MMDTGWIKIHRSLLAWEWYKDVPVKTLFLHLLLEANHDSSHWQGRDIQRGQCVVGSSQLGEKTGLSRQQVRTALLKLKKTGEITTESTNKFTIVTIVNYSLYQGYNCTEQPSTQPTINQQSTNNQPTNNQQITTNKNVKNVKNDKNVKNIGDYLTVISMYHDTCTSYPRIRSISDNRKRAINARLKKYSLDDFKTLFEKAEASDFLKGANTRNWSANFDWLIKDTNIPKVLEGNYDNRAKRTDTNGDHWSFEDYIEG